MTRRLPIMPVVAAIIIMVFGGLTLNLHDATFIKVKPTIIYGMFGTVLIGGLTSTSQCWASYSTHCST